MQAPLHPRHVLSTLYEQEEEKHRRKMSKNPTRGDEDKTVIERREQEERKG